MTCITNMSVTTNSNINISYVGKCLVENISVKVHSMYSRALSKKCGIKRC
jgi:hypothetical protein